MCYIILIFLNIILVFSFLIWKCQINKIIKQIRENRRIHVSLSDRQIEELARLINSKNSYEKELQIQILNDEEKLKQSISNISHDLRTPLTSIQGYLILLQNCDSIEEQKKYLSVIQSKADYLTELVQSFYDLSIIENGEYIVDIERLDINKLVTECLFNKYSELQAIQPVIKTEEKPVWINGNNIICRRIIENLIINAIRYSDGYIGISINRDGIFLIENTTSELNDINIETLFQKFYTVDKSRSKGNSGLGLYIVKELLKKINGGIKEAVYRDNVLMISVYFEICE
ncbi:MAG: HAMP domain-containing histidine kinase [Bacteroides sp.]|nr:HAMP domain-containing histidine kinase [Bacteroides sp.]MCM1550681.1 HAMP domain-containing histidine kinase [Clostridium sp.]